jgi:ATP-dependent RNA helicase DeaD
MEVWLRRKRYKNELETVTELIEAGYEPMDIAAAALRVVREGENQRAIEAIGQVREWTSKRDSRRPERYKRGQNFKKGGESRKKRNYNTTRKSHEAGMVRMALDKGRADGVRPADVVGTIAFHANIPGKSLGAIHIQDQQTYVDVPEQYVDQVMAGNGNYRMRNKTKLQIEKA